MKHDYLDRYSRIESPVHRLPGLLKFIIALCLVLVSIIPPARMFTIPFAVGVLVLLIVPFTHIPILFVLRRVVMFEPFVVVIAALMLFQPEGGLKFVSIVVKSTASLLTMIVLSNTVPFNEILGILRRIRVPGVIVTILALMYRYLFVLIDEAERLNRARVSRTFSKTKKFTWYSLSLTVGQLFVRSTERAESVFAAMSARGWK
jgi:cobalt/nickel transport system permease protein